MITDLSYSEMHLNQVKLSRALTTTIGSVRSNGVLDSITAAAQNLLFSRRFGVVAGQERR